MEATVLMGRDCRVFYQNARAAELVKYPIGTPIIWENPCVPIEQIRDAVFGEKPFSYTDMPLNPELGKDRLVTRAYQAIRDDAGAVMGIISLGFSRERAGLSEMDGLRAIIAALEEDQSVQSGALGGAHHPASSLGALSGSLRLAARLRRFLPPSLH